MSNMKCGEKKEYEIPSFMFEELKLSEDIANTCWGYAYAWYDANKDGDYTDPGETIHLSELGLGQSGCQGKDARETLKKYFKDQFGVELTKDQVSTNIEEGGALGGGDTPIVGRS